MLNIKDLSGIVDPAFIDMDNPALYGNGELHISGEYSIEAVKIGNDLYQVGRYIVNGTGDILGIK